MSNQVSERPMAQSSRHIKLIITPFPLSFQWPKSISSTAIITKFGVINMNMMLQEQTFNVQPWRSSLRGKGSFVIALLLLVSISSRCRPYLWPTPSPLPHPHLRFAALSSGSTPVGADWVPALPFAENKFHKA